MSSRRFLNIVLSCGGGLHNISQLDTSTLFYKSAAVAAAAEKTRTKNGSRKPPIGTIWRFPEMGGQVSAPRFTFRSFICNRYHAVKGADLFAAFGESNVLCAGRSGEAAIYDDRAEAVTLLPSMGAPKDREHVAVPVRNTAEQVAAAAARDTADCYADPDTELSVFRRLDGNLTDSLYVMNLSKGNNPIPFEALSFTSKGWRWHALPPPPFLEGVPPFYESSVEHAVAVKGATILVSPPSADGRGGTYAFDTVTHEWRKAAGGGDAPLPFLRRAVHDAELGHWFGFARKWPHHFCAAASICPTRGQRVWEDFTPPADEDWSLLNARLVSLGSGRFCVAKGFEVERWVDDSSDDDGVGTWHSETGRVFVGVEVVRCSDEPGGIKMIRHKTRCITNVYMSVL